MRACFYCGDAGVCGNAGVAGFPGVAGVPVAFELFWAAGACGGGAPKPVAPSISCDASYVNSHWL